MDMKNRNFRLSAHQAASPGIARRTGLTKKEFLMVSGEPIDMLKKVITKMVSDSITATATMKNLRKNILCFNSGVRTSRISRRSWNISRRNA